MPEISVIVPTYNEKKRIGDCLKSIREHLSASDYDYEVIISDDGSTDDTPKIVSEYQKKWPRLKIIKNSHKGKAPTIISGLTSAKGKYILFTDVDLSVSINHISKFIESLRNENYDLAIATREGMGAKRVNEPYTRHIMGRVFNMIVQLVLLPGINDTQCGFKMFKRECIQKIFSLTRLYSLDSPEVTGGKVSGFDVEILYLAKKLGYKVKEVPVIWVYKDNSKVHSLKDSYYNFMDVLRVRLNSIRGLYKV